MVIISDDDDDDDDDDEIRQRSIISQKQYTHALYYNARIWRRRNTSVNRTYRQQTASDLHRSVTYLRTFLE